MFCLDRHPASSAATSFQPPPVCLSLGPPVCPSVRSSLPSRSSSHPCVCPHSFESRINQLHLSSTQLIFGKQSAVNQLLWQLAPLTRPSRAGPGQACSPYPAACRGLCCLRCLFICLFFFSTFCFRLSAFCSLSTFVIGIFCHSATFLPAFFSFLLVFAAALADRGCRGRG